MNSNIPHTSVLLLFSNSISWNSSHFGREPASASALTAWPSQAWVVSTLVSGDPKSC